MTAILDTDQLRAALGPGSKRAKAAGERLAQRRQKLGVSQQKLGEASGTTLQTIFRIERGELVPRDYLRCAIAYALLCEVEDIWPAPTREEIHEAGVRREAAA